MKRIRYIFFWEFIVVCILFVGCNKTSDFSTIENDKITLNVENDSLDFIKIVQGIKEKEDYLQTELDLQNNSQILLFGNIATVKVSFEQQFINKIELYFQNVDSELLYNAIAEQLGSEGEKDQGETFWLYKNREIHLMENGLIAIE